MPLFGGIATSLLPQMIGSKQLGGIAPAFNQGNGIGSQVDSTALLDALKVGRSTPDVPVTPQGGVSDLVTSKPSVFNTDEQNKELEGPSFGDRFNGFFDNLDQNLQSPSKVIGLGLLNQIDPRLAGAGLLAGGLFGGN